GRSGARNRSDLCDRPGLCEFGPRVNSQRGRAGCDRHRPRRGQGMKAAGIMWRLSLAALLLTTTWQVWQLRRAPAWIAAQIERQGIETRRAALEAVASTRRDLTVRVDRLIDVSQHSIEDITRRADARLQDLTER